ncbi:DUF6541 family protein [Curtobacterium sp. S6]|uniref:DUF6541 family protein n=1 Tax=Curtobacterium sp. S6 TaxID=1479623 RepID=UPI0004AA0D3B|nr:DUF6541 family protein [Curtobacterium sp. S6]
MEWLSLIPGFLVCVTVLFVPGLLVTIAARMRGFDALALAPAVSVAIIAGSAMVAAKIGVGWALWVPLVAGLLVAVVVGAVLWGTRRLGISDIPRSRATVSHRPTGGVAVRPPWGEPSGSSRWKPSERLGGELSRGQWLSRGQLTYWITFALSALLLARTVKNSLGGPERFSQSLDNNFHLNVVRFIAETHNGSSLFVNTLTSGGTRPAFYPAAWHDLASLVFMSGSTGSVPMATNAAIFAVAGVVWPLSMLFLIRSTMRLNLPAVLAAGPLLAGFSAFPVLLIKFGVLYPNFLGVALLPAGVGIVVNFFRMSTVRRLDTVQCVLLGVVTALGIGLAHPNSLMSLLVIAVPIALMRAILQIGRALTRRANPWMVLIQVVLIAGLFALVWCLWGVIRPAPGASGWGPTSSDTQAFGEALLNSPLSEVSPQWVVSILAVLGAFTILYTRRNHWLVLSYGVIVYFYISIRWLNWDQDRMWVTGVWYNDPYRVAALLPVVAIPMAVIAVHGITKLLMDSRFSARLKGHRRPVMTKAVGVAVMILLAVLTQHARPMQEIVDQTYATYQPRADSPLLTTDELDVIDHVDGIVPQDETIVTQPWTGGSLAYALADRRVTAAHALYIPSHAAHLLNRSLNRAGTDPAVCAAVRQEHAGYVLDFGTHEINGGDHSGQYMGLTNLEERGVATTVYQSGDAKLLKITACG